MAWNSKTIFKIFKARIEYYIYPEQYEREVNETEINVFLNKCMYLLTVLFDLNFSFLRYEDFNESRKWAKDYILMVAKEFSTRYECEKEDFVNFFTKYTTKTMHTNNKFTKRFKTKTQFNYYNTIPIFFVIATVSSPKSIASLCWPALLYSIAILLSILGRICIWDFHPNFYLIFLQLR